MWDNLFRVDWGRLTHAYGWAHDVPGILHNIVARDQATRAEGWDTFFSAIIHQGTVYDSTVATVPFLIEAAANPDTPERGRILYYLRMLWLRAPEHGGDPLLSEPPGGINVPTPMVGDDQLAVSPEQSISATAEQEDGDEPDLDSYRRLDLCAWQIGRTIQGGQPTFERLLKDPDFEIAAEAAALLLLWPETRLLAKQTLIRTVARESNPLQQARRILEFGVYAAAEDVNTLAHWVSPDRPVAVRAAAGLVWAWLTNPAPVPPAAAAALRAASDPGCDAFAKLPQAGVYHRGPWILPANAAEVVLRLAENNDRELRWRAVQGLAEERKTAKHLSAAQQVVPVLLKCLTDDYNRIRAAAAVALSQYGDAVLDVEPNAALLLIRALEAQQSPLWDNQALHLDSDASVCGQAARLLAALSRRLTGLQRQAALAGIDRAARRYAGRDAHVRADHMHVRASQFLSEQRNHLSRSTEWSVNELFAVFLYPEQSDRRLSADDCDRKLADAYARAPEEVLAHAIESIRAGRDRNAASGAASWLMTFGPAAEPALEALDVMADRDVDWSARSQARVASAYIRQALLTTPDGHPVDGELSVRQRIAQLRCAADAPSCFGRPRNMLILELTDLLQHPDAYVRNGAAEGLALMRPTSDEMPLAIPTLERMLSDEGCAEVGIVGEFVCGGRLFHWRCERRSPRAGAIQALFAIGWKPDNDQILKAMLTEAQLAKIVCGVSVEPHRFPIAHWRVASQAAGGYSVAGPLICAARQQCQNQLQVDNNAAYVCAAELSEVIRVLSGRLVPTSDNHRLV